MCLVLIDFVDALSLKISPFGSVILFIHHFLLRTYPPCFSFAVSSPQSPNSSKVYSVHKDICMWKKSLRNGENDTKLTKNWILGHIVDHTYSFPKDLTEKNLSPPSGCTWGGWVVFYSLRKLEFKCEKCRWYRTLRIKLWVTLQLAPQKLLSLAFHTISESFKISQNFSGSLRISQNL